MLTVLLILIPFIAGIFSFAIKGNAARSWALVAAIVTLVVTLAGLAGIGNLSYNVSWIPQLGSRFAVTQDGMASMLCLLTAVSFPLIFVSTYHHAYKAPQQFYGLMLLTQAGLMGVFTATDALLFYVFWELALIPVYFLCSTWGGERRVAVTFKFFIYTFIGSLLMLVGIIYLYFQTPGEHTFSWQAFKQLNLDASSQNWLFWLFFIAFAIKMPIFPFHTWQPDTYSQSPTAVTMVLSGIMVKMGLYGVIRWLLPVLPLGVSNWSNVVIILSISGIVYASCLAIVQTDLKKLIAYSSIAHIGLMNAAVFSGNAQALQGALVQMFNHGVNIIGLWMIVEVLEQKLKTKSLGELGGIATHAPRMAVLLVIISLANLALPLTNGFVGEFLMFSGLYQYNAWMMAFAGLGIILAAVYMLNMIQKVIFGESNILTASIKDVTLNEWLAAAVIIFLIMLFGVYPKPMLELVSGTVQSLTQNL